MSKSWRTARGNSPVVATAIHNGHELSPDVEQISRLSEEHRLREEDPCTGRWAELAPTWFVIDRSRFEVDLNRPREGAIYLDPEDAWGLDLWKERPSEEIIERSLRIHDNFYSEFRETLEGLIESHGAVVVLDIHSYNHRRNGPDSPPQPQHENPDINIGTGSMPRHRWASIIDGSMKLLSSYGSAGRRLDVRENVKFRGGALSRWVHTNFTDKAFSVSIDLKKVFMDEWTGERDEGMMKAYEEMTSDLIDYLEASLR